MDHLLNWKQHASDILSYCNLSSLVVEIGFDILKGHQSTMSTRRTWTHQLPIYTSYIKEMSSESRLLSLEQGYTICIVLIEKIQNIQ